MDPRTLAGTLDEAVFAKFIKKRTLTEVGWVLFTTFEQVGSYLFEIRQKIKCSYNLKILNVLRYTVAN